MSSIADVVNGKLNISESSQETVAQSWIRAW